MVLEAGYECCSSPASVRDLFSKTKRKIDEKEVAETLGCMARTYTNMSGVGNGSSPGSSNWNVENFVTVVKELAPDLDWEKVIENLDYEHFFLYDTKGLDIIIRAWKESPKGSELFPANKFFGKWHNLKGQLSALYQIAHVSPDVLSMVALSQRKVIELEDFSASNAHVRAAAAQLVNDQFNSLDLIECVLDLADTPVGEEVKLFLKSMMGKSPELVFLGLIQIQPIKTLIHKDILSQLLLVYLTGHQGSTLVLTKFWQINPTFFIKSVLELYAEDPTSLMRILDFTHELKIIPQMLEVQPFFFAIDLAALASRREYLNLEKWLQDKISEHKDVFVRVCLDFLGQKITAEMSRQDINQAPSTVPLQVDVLGLFLKVLSESPMTPDNAELLKDVQSICLQTYPKLMNIRTQAEPGSTGAEVSFNPEVEKESNSNYERIYSGELSLEDFIERLKSYSTSKDPREQDLYACMIHNLFDEYSFFPKYPDKELAITSVLFGSLIQHHLILYPPLGSALRCVLDSLRKPFGSKMFNFGLQALTQFQSRLPEWPKYCAYLLQIPQLQQAKPELIRFINASLQTDQMQHQQEESMMPDMSAQPDIMPPPEPKAASQAIAFTTLKVPAVPMSAENINYEIPPELTQDKILFIINNLARNNLESKTSDLLNLLDQSAYQWFSNYLVVKRASIEPNYQELYLLLLDAVESKLLYQHVLRETYANIQILLNSEKTVSSSSERTLLKNLGAWLGGMTLARNKPIKHKNIAFKELLLEGYDNNRLIVVIPFVCKVLEQCNKSRVFKPPNPWLMAILKLLVELYQFAELKLNLKFEIEVLCKSLSLELSDIEATSVLKNRQPKDSRTVLAEMLARGDESSLVNHGRPMPGGNAMLHSVVPDAGFVPEMEESLMITLPNLAPYIKFNPQIIMYATQPGAKRLVLQAINQSIREIIDAVVERSVSIATVSTRELVIKDFAMESDEIKMRKAAHIMAQNLAGCLAMVTCREPLRLSLTANLRNIFLANGLTEVVAEQTAHMTVMDNLELVCAVIEKAAMEKATIDVDETMMNAYTARKKHREQRPGQPYFDMEIFSVSRYPSTLPELLRSKPNGLQPNQLQVYDDFARIPRSASSTNQSFEGERSSRVNRQEGGQFGYGYGNNGHSVASVGGNVGFDGLSGQPSAHQILERFSQYMSDLEKLANQTNVSSFSALPNHHDIRAIIRQIPALAASSFDKEEAARNFAQKVVQLLYKSETQLSRETFVVLLESLCGVAPNVGTLVTSWLTHADDERKYNVPVTVALIKSGLIHLPEQDPELGHLIDSGRTSAIDFTARLIRACVFGENPLANPQDFMSSLEALGRLRGNVPESVLMLMEDIRRYSQHQVNDAQDIRRLAHNQVKDPQEDEPSLRSRLEYLFTDWVHVYHRNTTTEKAQNAFIAQVAQQSILKVEDVSMLFYRVCIEASVEHAIKFKEIPGQSPSLAYQPIDAFSKLAIGIVKLQTDPTNVNHNTAKVNEFNKVTSVILLILAQHHEQRQQKFNQRPFMRLFTCLLSDLHAAEHQLQSVYIPLLTALSNSFHMLQPSYFPGFTFAWLQLISHRLFMPKLLLTENQKGWPTFQRLLICLFQFLVPFLRNVELRDTTRMLYRGTLRVLLVLLHDFPEFLCDYHYSFCDVIPSSCIQLRNLILSAFPRNMRLPDPFTPNLKVDLLPEINQSPRILSDYVEPLKANDFKQQVDEFIESQTPEDFLSGLQNKLLLSPEQKEASNVVTKYNLPVINALVFYVGVTGITQSIPVNQGSPMEIFQHLLNELDSEGRYLFLSAIANQLRYPNSHTHYFSCVLLYLFAESNKEIVKEQITRVLLERLIVNRPHPWGLLITFIELIKNPRYNFWNHSFTRCATDIERLFESVSRSINQI
ncbi:CCR4-Not complex component, Not1-domain-containing protein [Phycomyces nitens]|nr:CCR4-Not complex component, Not1-domain-containing protein [Phycomyces nitens]